MRRRYGEYLTQLKDEAYRDQVFAYVEKEDTPRSLMFQLDLLREVGFSQVDVLHKNACFAAFGAVKQGVVGPNSAASNKIALNEKELGQGGKMPCGTISPRKRVVFDLRLCGMPRPGRNELPGASIVGYR